MTFLGLIGNQQHPSIFLSKSKKVSLLVCLWLDKSDVDVNVIGSLILPLAAPVGNRVVDDDVQLWQDNRKFNESIDL